MLFRILEIHNLVKNVYTDFMYTVKHFTLFLWDADRSLIQTKVTLQSRGPTVRFLTSMERDVKLYDCILFDEQVDKR